MTGQERDENEGDTHRSSTIEICDFNNTYDVAVIDEIQMICDEHRGNSWTSALLGLQAKTMYLCGDE